MAKNKRLWCTPSEFKNRPSVLFRKMKDPSLLSWDEAEVEYDPYAVLDMEWNYLNSSIRIPNGENFSCLTEYRYNKKGEVQHRVFHEVGGEKVIKFEPIKVHPVTHRFVAKSLNMYMPSPEVCAGNGHESFRFNTLNEASYFLGIDARVACLNKVEIKGWRVEYGWPMPFIIGFSDRLEEYKGQFADMRKACEGKENKKNIKPYWDEDGERDAK